MIQKFCNWRELKSRRQPGRVPHLGRRFCNLKFPGRLATRLICSRWSRDERFINNQLVSLLLEFLTVRGYAIKYSFFIFHGGAKI